MMIRGLMIGAALTTLAACDTGRSLEDPAVKKLFEMSTPMFYASQRIASQVAQNCARYSYDSALDAQLNEARNEVGRGSLAANSLRNAIELETDVAQRSFQAKHDVELSSSDLCAAGDAEVLEGSAISALLIPA